MDIQKLFISFIKIIQQTMKKVKTSAVQWDGLDVHAWVEYQAELGEPNKNLLIKDYDNLTESQKDTLLSMCEEAIEEYEDSIISHINNCIAEFVSTNLDAIVKDLVKDKICSYAN